jgi:hypothetical protein
MLRYPVLPASGHSRFGLDRSLLQLGMCRVVERAAGPCGFSLGRWTEIVRISAARCASCIAGFFWYARCSATRMTGRS